MITQKALKKMLSYDPLSGNFYWISKPNVRIVVGRTAGFNNGYGYKGIGIRGITYYSHRLACLYMNGSFPKHGKEIDHINGRRDDNSWKNLRIVTRSVNKQNLRKAKSHNKTGFLGVVRRGETFYARIVVEGKQRHLGVYKTPHLAHLSYVSAKRKLHSGCTI